MQMEHSINIVGKMNRSGSGNHRVPRMTAFINIAS
jgi:hypothetical protein